MIAGRSGWSRAAWILPIFGLAFVVVRWPVQWVSVLCIYAANFLGYIEPRGHQ